MNSGGHSPNAPRVFVAQFVADELGEWSVQPTDAARQRWDDAANRQPCGRILAERRC